MSSTYTEWPSSRMEYWKYSNVESYTGLSHQVFEAAQGISLQDIPPPVRRLFDLEKFQLLVTYNGQYLECLSSVSNQSQLVLEHRDELDWETPNPFSEENKNNRSEVVSLQANAYTSDRPLLLLNLYGGLDDRTRLFPALNIEVKSSSNLRLFEFHYQVDEKELSLNRLTRLKVEDGSSLERVQAFSLSPNCHHFMQESLELAGPSSLRSLAFILGGQWTRFEQNAVLLNQESFLESSGAYILSDRSHCDVTTSMEHRAGSNQSEQVFKGLLADQSCGAFSGKVLIPQDSQKVATRQLNQNIVLSERAEANSRPQLEVYADDVTASHGSTTGALDPAEIFYLQSRGLSRSQSAEMVARAFVKGLTTKIEDPVLRTAIDNLLDIGFGNLIHIDIGDQ